MAIEQLIQTVLTASLSKRRELEDVLKGKAATSSMSFGRMRRPLAFWA